MARSIEEARARARAHEEEMLSRKWFTPRQLAARWGFKSVTSIYSIPVEQLRYKTFGTGKRPPRRYRDDWVFAYEEAENLTPKTDDHSGDAPAAVA